MANYNYDEAGNMAAYFVISLLAIVLVPMTLSTIANSRAKLSRDELSRGCNCEPCVQQRKRVAARMKSTFLRPKPTTKTLFLLVGWTIVAFLGYRVANADIETSLYDPFNILGIATGTPEKAIKSHFKKLSKLYHPDKVKATVNQTMEDIEKRFVEITKAYKALTDETIRRNYELYGHPDGKQELSMGIALPSWMVEGKNSVWVLGFYGILFGGVLPGMVGKWWFGNRRITKDGVTTKTAEGFWKGLTERSALTEVSKIFIGAFEREIVVKSGGELRQVEESIEKQLGKEWVELKDPIKSSGKATRALVLLYAHFLRLELGSQALQEEQFALLLQVPALLNAYLNIASARSWLSPTLSIMRLHSYIIQAVVPGHPQAVADQNGSLPDAVQLQGSQGTPDSLGLPSLEIVDLNFKVIGERVVTPSSIVYLLIKLRLRAQSTSANAKDAADKATGNSVNDDEIDEKFLQSRRTAEEVKGDDAGWAHAPYWPSLQKPGWWLVLADDKSNRVIVPPMKITDVPASDPSKERNYRCFKLQFQAPANVGLFTWKVYFVSDTVIGADVCKDIMLKIEDASKEQVKEDEISDPEEDSLAGQMAAMRGGSVKKLPVREDDDEESSTDESSEGDSSDSD